MSAVRNRPRPPAGSRTKAQAAGSEPGSLGLARCSVIVAGTGVVPLMCQRVSRAPVHLRGDDRSPTRVAAAMGWPAFRLRLVRGYVVDLANPSSKSKGSRSRRLSVSATCPARQHPTARHRGLSHPPLTSTTPDRGVHGHLCPVVMAAGHRGHVGRPTELTRPGYCSFRPLASTYGAHVDDREDVALTAEDYESVLVAMRMLSSRYRSGWTLNEALDQWRLVVEDIEEGVDTQWAWGYHNELFCRDWLYEAWPLLTARVRALRQSLLDGLDERFAAATAPMRKQETALGHRRGKWWHDRYPRLVSGEPGDELPETWSPAPEYVEDD